MHTKLYKPSKIEPIIECALEGPGNVSAWLADHAKPARLSWLFSILLMNIIV